jgi:hypothetical protein
MLSRRWDFLRRLIFASLKLPSITALRSEGDVSFSTFGISIAWHAAPIVDRRVSNGCAE